MKFEKCIKHYHGKTHGLNIYFSTEGSVAAISYEMASAIRSAIAVTLMHEEFPLKTEVSVVLCDNEYIRFLNAEYRNIDKPTDVLSFPMIEADEGLPNEYETVLLGDIVISLEKAAEQARELGHSHIREVQFLCVHSTLHLLGYDHEQSFAEEERMFSVQREIMKKFT